MRSGQTVRLWPAAVMVTLAALALLAGCREPGVPLTVYTAERILTMEPARPEATAAATALWERVSAS